MPLDGTASVALDLREAMFELRPPHIETKVFDFPSEQPITTKVLTTPIVRREVMGLVELCGKHQRLMSQHADVVPIVAWYDRQFPLDGGTYYFPPTAS